MKKTIKLAALCLALVMTASVFLLSSCSGDKNAVIKFVDAEGKTTGILDESFMSFWTAVQNGQYDAYISAFDAADGWQTVVDAENGKTLDDVMKEEAERTASVMLAAEYLHDNVYKISFTDEQQDSVKAYVNNLIATVGSEKALETQLSAYGANISSVERYMTLTLKYTTLYNAFYADGGFYAVSEETKKKYFEDNYSVIDHILFDTRGIQKDDGTLISLTPEQEAEKKAKAEEIFSAINGGVMDFDEAKASFNEDAYSVQYPFGYFVTDDNTFWSEFQTAALEMKEGEIRLVRTYAGYHIMRKLPMKGELYLSNGDFNTSLTQLLSGEDFVKRLDEASWGIVKDETALASIRPSLVKAFSFDAQ